MAHKIKPKKYYHIVTFSGLAQGITAGNIISIKKKYLLQYYEEVQQCKDELIDNFDSYRAQHAIARKLK